MSEGSDPKKWVTRGVFWREFAVGDAIGRPLAESAYRTPHFPEGITATDLRLADATKQRATLAFWFLCNLKPYDLTGGHYFSFGVPGRGFGEAPWAPTPVVAAAPIDAEFSEIVDDEQRSAVAKMFPGEWMWIEPPSQPGATSPQELRSAGDLQAELLTRLDQLADDLRRLVPDHGGMGHNLPPDELPVTLEEQAAGLTAIERTLTAVASGDARDAESRWSDVRPYLEGVRSWLAARLNDLAIEGFKSVGKKLGTLTVMALAAQLEHNSHVIQQLLTALAKLH